MTDPTEQSISNALPAGASGASPAGVAAIVDRSGFRLRGREVSRLEGFSDAVFETRASMIECGILLATACLSTVAAIVFKNGHVAGLSYLLVAPAFAAYGFWVGKRRRVLRAALSR